MFTNFFAQLGNAVITFFAFFVKLNPSWAYRFTNLASRHADKFLTGAKKELKVINDQHFKKGVSAKEIRNHLWSIDTIEEALKDECLGEIFANRIWNSIQFDCAMKNESSIVHELACSQKRYTPTAEQILDIANQIYTTNTSGGQVTHLHYEKLFRLLIKHHQTAFTAELLNKLNNQVKIIWFKEAEKLYLATPEQIEWAIDKTSFVCQSQFVKKFFLNMPKTEGNARKLHNIFPDLFTSWANAQNATTLYKCCMRFWKENGDEQGLRIIESKAFQEGNSDVAFQLITSTRKFVFQDALTCIVSKKASSALLLFYVDKENSLYPHIINQILSNSEQIKLLEEAQIAKFDEKQQELYWKRMALFALLSAKQYANLPDGKLKEDVTKILEDNALIKWLDTRYKIHQKDIDEFGDRELSPRVQCWLVKNNKRWLTVYFAGQSAYNAICKIQDHRNFTSKRATKMLSSPAFKLLVDNGDVEMLKVYLSIFTSILPEDRNYLLCSQYKDLAVNLGTI